MEYLPYILFIMVLLFIVHSFSTNQRAIFSAKTDTIQRLGSKRDTSNSDLG